ncbi:hypothetical protein GCM10027447_30060 [Glycomyces halotolerans]
MRVWKSRPKLLRGRVHGRLVTSLFAVAVVAASIAAWQFAIAMDGGDGAEWSPGSQEPPVSRLPDAGPSHGVAEESASDTASPSAEPSSEPAAEESSEAPTESADEPPSDPEPTGPQCVATLHRQDSWGNKISVAVEVANTGEESFDGWEVVIDIEGVEVNRTWGMEHLEDDRYGNGWLNGDLDPGETAEAGFRAGADGEPELPETVPCSPVA